MKEALIENGCAKTQDGIWLTSRMQPAAFEGAAALKRLKGFVVPDRAQVLSLETTGAAYFCDARYPFLTRLDAPPDEELSVVSAKVLVAPFSTRVGAKAVKLVPFSFNRATPVTRFKMGWVILATASRVTRVTLEEGQTLSVRPEAVAAWLGHDPSGFCPKLSLLDALLPRGPKNLLFTFQGPGIIWFEGSRAREMVRAGRWWRGASAS